MRRFGLMAALVGLLLAVCVPARAESADSGPDEVAMAMAMAKAKVKPVEQKDCPAREGAVREATKASRLPKPVAASADTLVVAAAGDQPGFTMVGENVTYDDPCFVPYKLRDAARRARAKADLARIP
jgi:hypothetical protein